MIKNIFKRQNYLIVKTLDLITAEVVGNAVEFLGHLFTESLSLEFHTTDEGDGLSTS